MYSKTLLYIFQFVLKYQILNLEHEYTKKKKKPEYCIKYKFKVMLKSYYNLIKLLLGCNNWPKLFTCYL